MSTPVNQHTYPPILPDIKSWPIYRLSQNKETFTQLLIDRSVEQVQSLTSSNDSFEEELAKTLYSEQNRIKNHPWKVDPKDEKAFWASIKKQLINLSIQKGPADNEDVQQEVFRSIIHRYAHEIVSEFNIRSYQFASKVLPIGFNRLLNTASARNMQRIWSRHYHLDERIKIQGHIDEVRNLATKGTIILVPTHHSNLDSILVGWTIHCLGLPAFLYGAGLNLFNSAIFGYFMQRLGAYKIDRRKKNLLYLETLKMYSRLTIQRGCHTLFFPGGTRSRSGQLENKLKLGLISTAMDAQRMNLENPHPDNPSRIFIVPLVISYHFVLEASTLIEQHLKYIGKEKYFVDKDFFPSSKAFASFFWKFFSTKSDVFLSLGQPMDLFGNALNESGESINDKGQVIDIAAYFKSGGKITSDPQRDSQYTQLLAQKIVQSYHKENIVLSSHLVAFAAMEILNKKHRNHDIYDLLRLPEKDRIIPYPQFVKVVGRLQAALQKMEDNEQVKLSLKIFDPVESLIQDGLKNIGIYHPKKVLWITDEGDVTTEDMNLLYFYHNRLKGYQLDEFI